METVSNVFVFLTRYILPFLAIWFLMLCARRLFVLGKKTPLARLVMLGNRTVFPIMTGECALGRSKLCDIRLNVPSVSRRHAILSFTKYGLKISMVSQKTEIFVNDIPVDGYAYLEYGDIIKVGGVKLELRQAQMEEVYSDSSMRRKKTVVLPTAVLTVIQILMMLSFVFYYGSELDLSIPAAYLCLIAAQWIYFALFRFSSNCAVDLLGFFLTSCGVSVAASALPSSLFKQLIAFVIGFAIFIAMNFVLRDVDITMKLRYAVGVLAVLLLAYNLLFGLNINGAKNWIQVGSLTIQPSELVKVAFIFLGAATLERLVTARNFLLFLAYAGVCIGALFLMRDFGTASIYFVTMLVIIYMRSGDLKAVLAILGVAVVGAFAIIKLMPYVADRFAAYRHVWELASTQGYQQTRTMMAIASGGLFGLGGGHANLDAVAASDTDLVFGIICEEWGLLVGLCVVACFIMLAVYVVRCVPRASSAYYAIAAVAAVSLYLFQTSLNIFGSTDLLPLTGVTMPFVSNGGSSMIASWCLLAYIRTIGAQIDRPMEV